eukprot:TRINITY_DN6509_c0_g3_i1.p1 TRINITY_DN6509_c0_g3~~TRINITY_DN6509_c0_g3_i1.p1  ORF type:complete len:527 (-),score=168.14 TRINITY_DN6509_c0_g3_i1:62-1642(-)
MSGRPVEGIVFPPGEKNDRSTTDAAKKIFASAFKAVGEDQLASSVSNERNWRYGYVKHILKHVETSLKNPEAALKEAQAGLDWMYQNFEFVRDGQTQKFADAVKNIKGSFETGFIKGTKPKPSSFEIQVPYNGTVLKGQALLDQLQKWASYGTIEQDAAEAISQVVKNKEWADLSDRYFVLLGAGSAMGPYSVLMALGANIVAIDLDRAPIWKRLIGIAKNSCGTLTFPLKKPQSQIKSEDELFENAGSNLITQAPEINNWLQTVYPDKPLVVGCYVYLDGEAHVKVVLACDAIMRGLSESRKASLVFLCTPTDAHVITDSARKASLGQYTSSEWRNLLLLPLRSLGSKKYLTKNSLSPIKASNGEEFSIVDGLVVAQGPNYALAKRMQHWRAIIARSQGSLVSTHIAPSTRTVSVVHNRSFAWAYSGMPYFKPYEIFDQESSNAVMSAILIHDLNNPKAAANPQTVLKNPLELFKYNSFHGGVWRSGYKVNSIGEVSVLVHFLSAYRFIFLGVLIAFLYLLSRLF